jgi:hypothetical protein
MAALLAALSAGCVSKSKALAQARLAYLAGQREASEHFQQQLSTRTVTFVGPVNQRVIVWNTELTLVGAILEAGYIGETDPLMVVIRRSGEEIQIDPARLLSGYDMPLQPGDIVEFQTSQL